MGRLAPAPTKRKEVAMYISALRPYALKRLEEIEKADILVGIPSFNNEKTIVHVVQMVSHGLNQYFKDQKNVIMIADGGSTDDTREAVKVFELKPWQEKLLTFIGGREVRARPSAPFSKRRRS